MVLEKKSDVGHEKKYKRKGNFKEGVIYNSDKEKTEYKGGVVGGCGCGVARGRK